MEPVVDDKKKKHARLSAIMLWSVTDMESLSWNDWISSQVFTNASSAKWDFFFILQPWGETRLQEHGWGTLTCWGTLTYERDWPNLHYVFTVIHLLSNWQNHTSVQVVIMACDKACKHHTCQRPMSRFLHSCLQVINLHSVKSSWSWTYNFLWKKIRSCYGSMEPPSFQSWGNNLKRVSQQCLTELWWKCCAWPWKGITLEIRLMNPDNPLLQYFV